MMSTVTGNLKWIESIDSESEKKKYLKYNKNLYLSNTSTSKWKNMNTVKISFHRKIFTFIIYIFLQL